MPADIEALARRGLISPAQLEKLKAAINPVSQLSAQDAAAMQPETYVNPLADQMIRGAAGLAMIPGQVYQSQDPVVPTDLVKPATDMAMALTLGAGAVPAEAGALRMGARLPGSKSIEAYAKTGALKPLSEMTDEELAAYRAQMAAEDAERAQSFAARRAAADTPAARRAEALRQKQIAEDEARMRREDEGH